MRTVRAPAARQCCSHEPHIRIESRIQSIELDQQHRVGIRGIACRVDRRLDGANRRPIHHLERRRKNSGRDDRRRRARARVDRHEIREQRAHALRIRRELHRDLERDAEASLGADERAEQVVALHLAIGVAERHDLAARENDLERDDVIQRHAVLQAVRPAAVLRDVAADRARGLARRIRRVVQAVRAGRARERHVHCAGLDDREPVQRIDAQDVVEAIEPDHHGVAARERARRESGARAARDEGQCARARAGARRR